MVNRFLAGALALALALVACPGGKDPKPDSGELTLAGVCREMMSGANAWTACLHGDPAPASDARLTAWCAAVEAEVAAGRVTYHAEQAGPCVAALRTVTCDTIDADRPECDAVVSGNVAQGGACLVDFDCASGHCVVGASCPGVCTAYVGVGGDCSAAGARCAPGLGCGGGRCVAVTTPSATQGQPCVSGTCASGLYCDPTTSKCAPSKKSGSCAGAPDACMFGYACVESGVCVALAGRGERCGPEARCGAGWACSDGVCGPPPGIGAPCASGSGRTGLECAYGAYCDTSPIPTCRELKPGGAACGSAWECRSYVCTAGACAPEPATCFP
jgi:hypothetical protein